MFRKATKNKNKKRFLKKKINEEEDDDKSTTSKSSQSDDNEEKRFKKRKTKPTSTSTETENKAPNLLNEYKSTSTSKHLTEKDLATKTVEFHPDQICKPTSSGPMRAPTFIRSTTRFDYQPDICKDYKQTGFCGFGDTCIYMHDRGDTLSGWQLERQWEDKKKKEQKKTEKDVQIFMNQMMDKINDDKNTPEEKIRIDDGIPFACHICRSAFHDPVITTCQHYFCEHCIMEYYKDNNKSCPVCGNDTNGIFNHPTKLISKRKKLVRDGNWNDYYKYFSK